MKMTPRSLDPRRFAAAGLLLLICAVLPGCEPNLNEQEYGRIIYEVPKVDGANRPYPLPQLEDTQEKPSEDDK